MVELLKSFSGLSGEAAAEQRATAEKRAEAEATEEGEATVEEQTEDRKSDGKSL